MSTFLYIVGNLKDTLDEEMVADVTRELHCFHLTEKQIFTPDWTSCPKKIVVGESLNLASLCLFLDHVAELEGFKDSSSAISATRFKHLPYWMSTVWIPIDFEQTSVLYAKTDPLCIASSVGLLRNLEAIRALSPSSLGNPPECYGNEGGVPESSPSPDDDCLRWVWYDLFQVGTLSLKHGAPVWGCSA